MTALDVDLLRTALLAHADATRADGMAQYMKGRFEFLGIPAAVRRRAAAATKSAAAAATGDEVVVFARRCWDRPEREIHYVAADVLGWNAAKLRPRHLADLEFLVTTNSWWDTVDGLATWSVGGLVAAYPELALVMDEWIRSDDIWKARTAILHQLRYGDATDQERLFRYTDLRAGDAEFFIRKALGWALRQYARTDPDAVREYVTTREHRLSALTRREAMKHLAEPA